MAWPMTGALILLMRSASALSRKSPAKHKQAASKINFLNYLTERDHKGKEQRTLFYDKEHLYEENQMLRTKIKQLTETNDKTKTKLIRTEKNLHQMAQNHKNEQISESVFRGNSLMGNKSTMLVRRRSLVAYKEQEELQGTFVNALRRNIGQLKAKLEEVTNQYEELKRSLKFTRISELQAENRELQEENLRMRKVAEQAWLKLQAEETRIALEAEELRKSLRSEVEAKNQAKKLAVKLNEQNSTFSQRFKELQSASQKRERGLQTEVRRLRAKSAIMLDFNEQIRRPLSREMDTANRLQYSTSGDAVDKTDNLFPTRSGDRLLQTGEKLLSDPRIDEKKELSSIHSAENPQQADEQEHNRVDPLPDQPQVSPLNTEKEGPSIELELRKREEQEEKLAQKDEYAEDDFQQEEGDGKASQTWPLNTNPLLPVQSSTPQVDQEYDQSFQRLC